MGVDTKTGIIYCWRNVHNEKRYIGQTVNPKTRFNEHKRHLGNYDGQNLFGRALNKYSSMDDWEYTVIEEVPKEMLDQREINWIAFYNSNDPKHGYNTLEGGHNVYGYEFSEESRRKMSESHKGKKHSEETRRKISGSLKGRKFSEETRRKISESHKGKKHTPEARKNMSNSHNSNKIGVFQNDMLIAVCDTIAEVSHIADVSKHVIFRIIAGRYHQTKSGYSFKYISKSA